MEPDPNTRPDSRPDISPQERDRLREERHRTEVSQQILVADRAIRVISYLVGALLILLTLRFFLRLSGANPENTFANFIYGFSEPFVSPFSTLFVSPTNATGTTIFDVNLLVAMMVYAILGWLAIRLVRTIFEP